MKPIAEIVWAGGIEDSIKDVRFYKVPSPDVGTKLYTHPVKELTDEEIMEVANEIFSKYKNWHHYQIDFARAILRKAQE